MGNSDGHESWFARLKTSIQLIRPNLVSFAQDAMRIRTREFGKVKYLTFHATSVSILERFLFRKKTLGRLSI